MIKNKTGFTLIEILVVVAIIAILSSVVLIGLGPTRMAARDAQRIANLREVQNGMELYFNKCGFYPGGNLAVGVCPAPPWVATASWAALSTTLIGGGFAAAVPLDPVNAGAQQYKVTVWNNGTKYELDDTFEDINNSALKNSLQGTVNGVVCGTAGRYCVGL